MDKAKLIAFLEEIDAGTFDALWNRWDDAKAVAQDAVELFVQLSADGPLARLILEMAKEYLRGKHYTVDHMDREALIHHFRLELSFQDACLSWAEELKANT